MYKEFTAIVAGDLLPNQKFSFEDSHNATVFCALGVYTSYVDLDKQETQITLSDNIAINMPSTNALYLVTELDYINVTRLQPGERLFDVDGQIYNISVVIDGSTLDKRLSPGEWTFVGVGNNKWHTHKNDAYVYRLPALVGDK